MLQQKIFLNVDVAGVQPAVVLPAAAGELLPPASPEQQPAATGQGGQTGQQLSIDNRAVVLCWSVDKGGN